MRTPPPVTENTPIGADVNLETENITLPSGRRLTETVVGEYVQAAHRVGRSPLTSSGTHSPNVTVRLPQDLYVRLVEMAQRSGVRKSAIIREALEEKLSKVSYVDAHNRTYRVS